MAFEKQLIAKKGFIFGLDDVLYPEKDYLLQVMQDEFANHGSAKIFEKTATKFEIPLKYEQNFTLLHQNARLPLKLLLYQQVLNFLQEIVVERKEIFLLVDGDPVQQLNKIKQIEWHGLEQYLKVYFSAEFTAKPSAESIIFILESSSLQKEEVLLVGANHTDKTYAENVGIDYLGVEKIL